MRKMNERLPRIFVDEADRTRLRNLAYSALDQFPDVAEELLAELDRAESPARRDVVKMGSTVEFETDTGFRHMVRLVFPADADISAGRVSVLTPIGTALLGLTAGENMSFIDREGRERELTILSVAAGENC